MKKNLLMSLAILALVPSLSFANITCNGIIFDISKGADAEIVEISRDDSEYHTRFTATHQNVVFNVVVENETEEVTGSISFLSKGNEDYKKGSVNFTGTFTKNGRFSFATMRGGNLMMPAQYEAIECQK